MRVRSRVRYLNNGIASRLMVVSTSYAARMYEIMQEMGIDPRRDTKLRTLIIGAEPHSEEQRRR